jgi:hypothetical protein
VASDIISGTSKPESGGSQLRIYPNPAGSILYLSFPDTLSGSFLFTLQDISGRTVKSGYIPLTAGSGSIPLHSLPRGTYLLHLKTNTDEYYAIFIRE